MKLHSGVKHLGDIQRDETLTRALRFIEENEEEFPEDFGFSGVEAVQDSVALAKRIEGKAPNLVAQSIQYVLLRILEVVRAKVPDRNISGIEYRYINYVDEQDAYVNSFTGLHTDPSAVALCSFGASVAKTRVFKGVVALDIPDDLKDLSYDELYSDNYDLVTAAISTAVNTALASGQGEMIVLDEASVDLLDKESIHARSLLLSLGHRHLFSVFFHD